MQCHHNLERGFDFFSLCRLCCRRRKYKEQVGVFDSRGLQKAQMCVIIQYILAVITSGRLYCSSPKWWDRVFQWHLRHNQVNYYQTTSDNTTLQNPPSHRNGNSQLLMTPCVFWFCFWMLSLLPILCLEGVIRNPTPLCLTKAKIASACRWLDWNTFQSGNVIISIIGAQRRWQESVILQICLDFLIITG